MQSKTMQTLCVCSLLLLITACSEPWSYPSYPATAGYPTLERQRVREICTLLYEPPYSRHVAPSLSRKVQQIRPDGAGITATFTDRRTYRVPINSNLPPGRNYQCTFRSAPTPCMSRNDWDTRCERNKPPGPNRFQY